MSFRPGPSPEFVAVMINRDGYDELVDSFGDYPGPRFVYISPGSPQVSNSFERIVIATVSLIFFIHCFCELVIFCVHVPTFFETLSRHRM